MWLRLVRTGKITCHVTLDFKKKIRKNIYGFSRKSKKPSKSCFFQVAEWAEPNIRTDMNSHISYWLDPKISIAKKYWAFITGSQAVIVISSQNRRFWKSDCPTLGTPYGLKFSYHFSTSDSSRKKT